MKQSDKSILLEAGVLLQSSANEIKSLRNRVEKQSIRLDAIDDMLSVLNGKPGTRGGEGCMHPDVVYEINQFMEKVGEVTK